MSIFISSLLQNNMKKSIVLFVVLIMCVAFLVGCSATESEPDQNNLPGSQYVQEDEHPEEKEPEPAIVNKIDTSTKDDSSYYDALTLHKSLKLDFAEIEFNDIQIVDSITPKDTSGVYMYLEDEAGSTYFDLVGSVKNTGNEEVDVENIVIQFVFDNQYKYEGFVIADAGVMRASDKYVNPLDSVDIHIYTLVPDELIGSFKECKIRFGFKKNFLRVWNFNDDIGMCNYKYEVSYHR